MLGLLIKIMLAIWSRGLAFVDAIFGTTEKAVLTFTTGFIMKGAINYPFDYLLYPSTILWLGSIIGGILMIGLSVIINILLIRAYDWSKVDWFLIEKIKSLDEKSEGGFIIQTLKRVRNNKTLTFFVLCLDDPITVTLYFREGSYQYNGMSKRDWKIFIASTAVSNMYWIIGWTAILQVGIWVWAFFH